MLVLLLLFSCRVSEWVFEVPRAFGILTARTSQMCQVKEDQGVAALVDLLDPNLYAFLSADKFFYLRQEWPPLLSALAALFVLHSHPPPSP